MNKWKNWKTWRTEEEKMLDEWKEDHDLTAKIKPLLPVFAVGGVLILSFGLVIFIANRKQEKKEKKPPATKPAKPATKNPPDRKLISRTTTKELFEVEKEKKEKKDEPEATTGTTGTAKPADSGTEGEKPATDQEDGADSDEHLDGGGTDDQGGDSVNGTPA